MVYLKNGDRITGAVEKLSDSKLVVKSSVLGEVNIDTAQVDHVSSDNGITVAVADKQYKAKEMTFVDENANLSVSNTQAVSLPKKSVSNVYSAEYEPKEEEPSIWQGWYSSADAGMSAARGNTETTNLNLGFHASRTTLDDQLSFGMTSLFSQSMNTGETITGANSIHGGARYDRNVSNNAFTFALTNFDSDQLQDLDLRAVVGGGLGLRLAQSESTSFNIFTGASLNDESYSTQPERRSGELLTGQEFNVRLSQRAGLSQHLMFFPNLTDRGEYRIAFDSSATLKFNKWLGWQSTLTNMYVSNPAFGARSNDLLLTTGIRVMLGAEGKFKPRLQVPATFTE
ncbi:MAG TPA: DUF481 domain-containing protein [Terriglobales bacterium]|nr:DUF481 domain-containing protein [Terriglobales bacterium]